MEGTGVSVQPVSMFQRFGFYSAVQSCELHPAMDAALYGELCIPTNARPGEASFQSVLEDVSVGGLFCVFRGLNIGIIRVSVIAFGFLQNTGGCIYICIKISIYLYIYTCACIFSDLLSATLAH